MAMRFYDRSGKNWVEFTDDGQAIVRSEVIENAMQKLARMDLDYLNRLRVIVESSSVGISTGASLIGTAGLQQKMLAAYYADSTSTLGANAVFSGTSRDGGAGTSAPYNAYAIHQALAISDVTGTLFIEESTDGSNFYVVTSQATAAVVDSAGNTRYVAAITWKLTCRYSRVVYKNGAGAQGLFRLNSRVIGA